LVVNSGQTASYIELHNVYYSSYPTVVFIEAMPLESLQRATNNPIINAPY